MTLRIVHVDKTLPISYPVDPSCEFRSGTFGEPIVIGNQVFATVSNGSCPIFIFDDEKTKAFTSVSWNETIITPMIKGVPGPNNTIITPFDIKCELKRPNIIPSSFASTIDVVLNPINGVITFVAGTVLNLDCNGNGMPNAIKAIVNYTYAISNLVGDDSTAGSGRVTCWYQRGIFQSDVFETNQAYPLKCNLYVNEVGMLTSRKPSRFSPAVCICLAPPSTINPMLEFLLI